MGCDHHSPRCLRRCAPALSQAAMEGGCEVLGLDPATNGLTLSPCTEDLIVGTLSLAFAAAFASRLLRLRRHPVGRRVETADPSIYGGSEEEVHGLLGDGAVPFGDGDEATIHRLAADRSAEAVQELRRLADEDVFANCESAPLRTASHALAALATTWRVWALMSLLDVLLHRGSATAAGSAMRTALATAMELLAWSGAFATAWAESSARQPRSSLVMSFWVLSAAGPALAVLRAQTLRAVALKHDGSVSGEDAAVAQATVLLATAPASVGLALSCVLASVGAYVVRQQLQSTVWHTYQGAWSLQREGDGTGCLERLLGMGDTGGELRDEWGDRTGGSWCPEKSTVAGGASIGSKVRRLLRLGRPDAMYVLLGIAGFIAHASAKVYYQLLYGQLINAVYQGDAQDITWIVVSQLIATLLMTWFDQFAGVFLEIGAARLSLRLQRQVFNLIMEQDAAFYDRMKTGSLMTILSTNVGSIQNVLVQQSADLAEGVSVTAILLVYMLVREWRLTLILVVGTAVPLLLQGLIGWIAEKKTEELMMQEGAQGQAAEEQIGEVRTVKSLGHEDAAKQIYSRRARAAFRTRVRLTLVITPLEGLVDSLFGCSLVLCFWLGATATLEVR